METFKKHSKTWFIERIGKPVYSLTGHIDFLVHNKAHAEYLYFQQEMCNKLYEAFLPVREYPDFRIPKHLRIVQIKRT